MPENKLLPELPNFTKSSGAEKLAWLPLTDQAAILSEYSAEALAKLLYDWKFWGRPNQLAPPGNWRVWLLMAGRGFGKTRTGAEYVRFRVDTGCRQIGLVGPTAADTRDIMVRGESGLLSIYPPSEAPVYQPSNRRRFVCLPYVNDKLANETKSNARRTRTHPPAGSVALKPSTNWSRSSKKAGLQRH
jgi:hypothetical protein